MGALRGLKTDQVVKLCRLESSKNFVSKGEDLVCSVFIHFEPVQRFENRADVGEP